MIESKEIDGAVYLPLEPVLDLLERIRAYHRVRMTQRDADEVVALLKAHGRLS